MIPPHTMFNLLSHAQSMEQLRYYYKLQQRIAQNEIEAIDKKVEEQRKINNLHKVEKIHIPYFPYFHYTKEEVVNNVEKNPETVIQPPAPIQPVKNPNKGKGNHYGWDRDNNGKGKKIDIYI